MMGIQFLNSCKQNRLSVNCLPAGHIVFFKFCSSRSFVKSRWLWDLITASPRYILTSEAIKVAGETWQRSWWTLPTTGSYIQHWGYQQATEKLRTGNIWQLAERQPTNDEQSTDRCPNDCWDMTDRFFLELFITILSSHNRQTGACLMLYYIDIFLINLLIIRQDFGCSK